MVDMKAAHSMSVLGVSSFVAILFIWGFGLICRVVFRSSCSSYTIDYPALELVMKILIFCRPDDTWIDLLQSCEVIFVRMFVDVEINYKMPSV